MSTLLPMAIARICHEANRAYCHTLGDKSPLPWEDISDELRHSAIDGVRFHLANPDAVLSDSHKNWLAFKQAHGWKYGPIKDEAKKEHPCFVPYDELPSEQQRKNSLFFSIVRALS